MAETSALRARFAAELSAMDSDAVPAYRTLIEVAGGVTAEAIERPIHEPFELSRQQSGAHHHVNA